MMMTLDEARNDIGSLVLYLGAEKSRVLFDKRLIHADMVGLIHGVGTQWVFVLYPNSHTPQATAPELLQLLVSANALRVRD
jgi:hypothetical protein